MKYDLCNLIQFVKLEENSQYPETLHVTEGHQYRERGLLHITDDVYQFFMLQEQKRVEMLNINKLQKANQNMVEKALTVQRILMSERVS